MQTLLWIYTLLPLAGFLVLVLVGKRFPRGLAGFIGAGSVGASFLLALITGIWFVSAGAPEAGYTATLGQWVTAGALSVDFSLHLDALSVVMVTIITFVGFLIHYYSVDFMKGKGDYHLFFAYMNLFVFAMLTLVLADNFLLLFLGWEGVGLCSYLLIGFWYQEPANDTAARKAFIVTRIGDVSLLVGIFLLFVSTGTLNLAGISQGAATAWTPGGGLATAAALLILGGAVGKSAQLPLQVWLPDAMAGPTPVSALIHAATMVTAGVYLIARTHVIFALAPVAQLIVAIIGAATLLYGGLNALTQVDIKRVLAYSTISQIGYMFLGLGVGAWTGAMFHFATHAFFKALLFLGAGVLIHVLHEEHNIYRMGGMRKAQPLTFWTFVIGVSSLSGVPLVTSGFYSKEAILSGAWTFGQAGTLFWLAGAAGVLLTAMYSFRILFFAFTGDPAPGSAAEKQAKGSTGGATLRMQLPLAVLATFAVILGFLFMPGDLGGFRPFAHFLEPLFASVRNAPEPAAGTSFVLQLAVTAMVALGILFSYFWYRKERGKRKQHEDAQSYRGIRRFLLSGMGFDVLYRVLFTGSFNGVATLLQRDWISAFFDGVAWVNRFAYRVMTFFQTGLIRWYLMGIGVGIVVLFALVVFV